MNRSRGRSPARDSGGNNASEPMKNRRSRSSTPLEGRDLLKMRSNFLQKRASGGFETGAI